MIIGIDISQIIFAGTGTARYTENLVRSLLKIDRLNKYILFYSSFRRNLPAYDFLSAQNAVVKKFRFPPSVLDFTWNIAHRLKIEKLIGNIDVFHSSDWTQPPSKTKKITTVHDLVPLKYPQSMPSEVKFNLRRLRLVPNILATQKRRLYWTARDCDMVMADSRSTADDLVKLLKIPAGKIKVVYLGVEGKFRPPAKNKIKAVAAKYHLGPDYLLSVGTREPRKNLKRVLESFTLLKKEHRKYQDLELVIAGKFGWGKDIPRIKGVRVTGFVPDEDLPSLYAGAGAFVYPSLYEGFGLPVLEAMSCACPVVTSQRGSLKEIAGPSLIADPENIEDIKGGILKILQMDKHQKSRLKDQGIAWAEKFTWEQTARKTLEVYEQIIK